MLRLFGVPSRSAAFRLVRCRRATRLDAAAKRIHEIDNVRGFGPLRLINRFAFLLLFQQLFERIFVLVLKLTRIKVSRLGIHDVRGQLEHVLGNLLIGNIVEIVCLVANLVKVAQRDAKQSLATRLKRHDVLAGREHDLADCNHTFFADSLPDHGERLLADFSVRYDVIGAV